MPTNDYLETLAAGAMVLLIVLLAEPTKQREPKIVSAADQEERTDTKERQPKQLGGPRSVSSDYGEKKPASLHVPTTEKERQPNPQLGGRAPAPRPQYTIRPASRR